MNLAKAASANVKTKTKAKSALIIGATGATGRCLTRLLLKTNDYQHLHLVHYRPTGMADDDRISEHILSFDTSDDFGTLEIPQPIDTVFCCLGTTLKQAGSVKAFARVDKDFVLAIARWSAAQGVSQFHVISSLGVNARSCNYYSRTKGEMEQALKKLKLPALFIYRPSMLDAERHPARLNEKLSMPLIKAWCQLPLLKRFSPLKVTDLAAAMLLQSRQSATGVKEILSVNMQDKANKF